MIDLSRPPTVVITTINPPPGSVQSFLSSWGSQVICVGDAATPRDWEYPGVVFLSLADQASEWPEFAESLPLNHYSRKMFGYLRAIESGATYVFDTDDDNYAVEDWSMLLSIPKHAAIETSRRWVNIYSYFSEEQIWPRGLPLREATSSRPNSNDCKCDGNFAIVQSLANGRPDFDAIGHAFADGRNLDNFEFEKGRAIELGPNCVSPLNSQSTLFSSDVFELLYLPQSVSFRFADILRGWIAVSAAHSVGKKVCFVSPVVSQIRNEHDFSKDFADEVAMHLYADEVVETVENVLNNGREANLGAILVQVYQALAKKSICSHSEVNSVENWVSAVAEARRVGASVR